MRDQRARGFGSALGSPSWRGPEHPVRARGGVALSAIGAALLLGLGALSAGGCGKENTVNAGSPMCQAGELRCSSALVEVCQEDGSAFELQEVCSGGTPFCAAGACVECEVGSQYCSGNAVYGRCEQSSDQEILVLDCAAVGQVCSGGRCRVQACEPASVVCDGNTVVTCATDGLSVASRTPCGVNERCFEGVCEEGCSPGAKICNLDGQVEVCSEDGLTVIERRSCSAAQGCEDGECRPLVCEPDSSFCRGDRLIRCSASGTSEQEQPCGVGGRCVDDAQGVRCVVQVCEPNLAYCDGVEPWRCHADGQGASRVGDACTGATTCSAGACVPWVCTPALEFCDGDQPKACAVDGLGATNLGPACPSEVGCSGGRCCQPAERFCVGHQVMDCSADGMIVTEVEVCPASQYCIAGGCSDDHDGYARWPLPGTAGHPFDYSVDVDAKTVLDQVTGLLWQREPAPTTHTFDDAKSHCEGLTWGGRDDWRLPTRMELISIVDYTRGRPTLDSVAFPGTPQAAFWAGPRRSNDALSVDFGDGTVDIEATTVSRHVRCVAEVTPQLPIPASGHYFQVTGNTVLDGATGLEWQRGSAPSARSQAAAISYCDGLALDGKTGWRLPSASELSSLIPGLKLNSPLIDGAIFTGTFSAFYWSADAWYLDSRLAFAVGFSSGRTWRYIATGSRHVRCVR
ncbi:MAG: DUF1566 domain-containing protein [Polyangiaceae bacterium]|nr:DUF1566 domain-containing protein [Polyangiaceae bacterium]MCW5792064.1 DUF1566 domain-containing protein [Polyangiaceae bacterium]